MASIRAAKDWRDKWCDAGMRRACQYLARGCRRQLTRLAASRTLITKVPNCNYNTATLYCEFRYSSVQ